MDVLFDVIFSYPMQLILSTNKFISLMGYGVVILVVSLLVFLGGRCLSYVLSVFHMRGFSMLLIGCGMLAVIYQSDYIISHYISASIDYGYIDTYLLTALILMLVLNSRWSKVNDAMQLIGFLDGKPQSDYVGSVYSAVYCCVCFCFVSVGVQVYSNIADSAWIQPLNVLSIVFMFFALKTVWSESKKHKANLAIISGICDYGNLCLERDGFLIDDEDFRSRCYGTHQSTDFLGAIVDAYKAKKIKDGCIAFSTKSKSWLLSDKHLEYLRQFMRDYNNENMKKLEYCFGLMRFDVSAKELFSKSFAPIDNWTQNVVRQRVEETAAVIPEPVAKKSRIVSFDSMLAEYADVLNKNSKIYSFDKLLSPKARKKEDNAVNSYAHFQKQYGYAERPSGSLCVLIDTTILGSASDGVYITDDEIYAKPIMGERVKVALKDVKSIKLSTDSNAMIINGVDFAFTHSELRKEMGIIVDCIKRYIAQL